MNLRRRVVVTAAALLTGLSASWLGAQTASQDKPLLSEQVFKNIQVLKGIPVDDFLGTMGLMSAALQFDCSDCHVNAGTDTVEWAADTPRKRMARRMVTMVANINKENFGGRQVVTCWSCHRNRDRPLTTPTMETIYGMPTLEPDDIIVSPPGLPSPESVLDKFIEASGGAQRLAGITSFDGKGTSVGFGGFGGGGEVEIVAKAPDKRATIILFKAETGRGDQIRTYNGREGWVRTPLNVLGEFQLRGGDLDGARFDAQLSFSGQIKQILTNLKAGPATSITDLPAPDSQTVVQQAAASGPATHSVNVVQGAGPRGLLVTLYFDRQSGLLLRELRYGPSPIGRVPTQIDFADYRDVNGIKLPFRITYAWLDGRDSISLSDIKINVPVDEAKFGRPAPLKK
ncbi:MAG: photosynthetic reaction center cytochrome c subunit [Bryobacterales bacterium]|nr:photosynthetic reaction center cytochrome c subunit [Bryobacterales bacterium]MBV9399984.1 photosynthetic reaction center cytochrome c subunit [Bryobacterales bacterium]